MVLSTSSNKLSGLNAGCKQRAYHRQNKDNLLAKMLVFTKPPRGLRHYEKLMYPLRLLHGPSHLHTDTFFWKITKNDAPRLPS